MTRKQDVANDVEFKAKLKVLGDMKDRHEISEEKMIEETKKLYGENGFFDKLKEYIDARTNNKIPIESGIRSRLSLEAYEELRAIKEKEVITENWVSYWRDKATWLTNPTLEDKQDITEMSEDSLAFFGNVLWNSLKDMVDAKLEQDPKTLTLNEYYRLLKAEMCQRFPDFPSKDDFQDYIQNRANYVSFQTKLEQARINGSPCPYCNSTSIRKDGNSFLCKDCGKRWRKSGYN